MLALLAAVAASPVTLHGVGELRVGMPLAELRRMGAKEEFQSEDGVDCSYWTVPREDVALMVSGRRVVRIDINNPKYRTPSGARVGMTEAEVRRIYGRALKVEPHPYTGPEGHYLVYRAKGEPYGMIFETEPVDRKPARVVSFRVGLWKHVQLIEGCS
jgi:hypothetical protein